MRPDACAEARGAEGASVQLPRALAPADKPGLRVKCRCMPPARDPGTAVGASPNPKMLATGAPVEALGVQAGSSITDILSSGGDSRLHLKHGVNKYFCPPYPLHGATVRGSCTSSPPTTLGYDAAKKVWDAICASPDVVSAFEADMEAVRARIAAAFQVPPDTAVVLAASGTDAEYVPLAVARELYPGSKVASLLAAAEEVGSGCLEACGGAYFDPSVPYQQAATEPKTKGAKMLGFEDVEVIAVPARTAAGEVVDTAETLAARVRSDVDAGADRVWVVRKVVGTKTGFETTLPADTALPEKTFTVVDACQLRVTPAQVREHLAAERMVLITGSKFMQGAAFSGAVLLPPGIVGRLRAGASASQPLPGGFSDYFSKHEVPASLGHWRAQLHGEANVGLLLRWHTALPLVERVCRLPEVTRAALSAEWAEGVAAMVARTDNLEALCTDCGIVSIKCKRADGEGYHNTDDLKKVHKWIASDMSGRPGAHACTAAGTIMFIGQPVKIMEEVAVLRIALGAELLHGLSTGAYSPGEDEAVVAKLSWAVASFAELSA